MGSSLDGKFFQIDKKGKLYSIKFSYNSHDDDGSKESLKQIRGCVCTKPNWTQYKIELPRLRLSNDDEDLWEE